MINGICFIAAIVSYASFLTRFAWQGLLWFRNPPGNYTYSGVSSRDNSGACISTMIDVIFFRRIFSSSKILWIFSWMFHLSFFFVMVRHLRYFFPSLPTFLILLQPAGLFFGYLLPASLFFLIIFRTIRRKNRYASLYNYGISGMLLLISLIGIMMRTEFRPDTLAVKEFMLGVFSLSPGKLPDSILFLLHVGLVMLLLPFLPTHFLAAPFVTFEASRRSRQLRSIIHDE